MLDRFIGLVPPNGSILDVGCGSGEPIARYLTENGMAITGIDSSPAMIDICRSRFPSHTWLVADMRMLTVGRRFSGLLAWDSFFHLRPDDQRAMFSIFRDHAASGTALMFTSGSSFGEAIGSFHGELLYHGSLETEEYADLLHAHGFSVVGHVVDDPHCGGHTIWLARRN
jgi:trans-aconitate methyltransferase